LVRLEIWRGGVVVESGVFDSDREELGLGRLGLANFRRSGIGQLARGFGWALTDAGLGVARRAASWRPLPEQQHSEAAPTISTGWKPAPRSVESIISRLRITGHIARFVTQMRSAIFGNGDFERITAKKF
jgi:hypothetical protein